MKLLTSLSSLLASANAWDKGSCDDTTPGSSSMICKNSSKFDWIGRGEQIRYREMINSEYSLSAQVVARKWNLPYLNKEDGYVGMLRFDRTYCKRSILRAIGQNNIVINIGDRTKENYRVEAQYYERPADDSTKKEAAVVQFRRSGFVQGEFLDRGKDRFFVSMHGIDEDSNPLGVSHEEFHQCFANVGLLTMQEDYKGFESVDYTKAYLFKKRFIIFWSNNASDFINEIKLIFFYYNNYAPLLQRYNQTPDWKEGPLPRDTFIFGLQHNTYLSFLISGDGSSRVSAPVLPNIHNTLLNAGHAVIRGELYFFGGSYNVGTGGVNLIAPRRIGKLEDCQFKELSVALSFDFDAHGGSVLGLSDNSGALVCFGGHWDVDEDMKRCTIFDVEGEAVTETYSTVYEHRKSSLAYYRGKPTATCGMIDSNHSAHTKVETLHFEGSDVENGWSNLIDHPLQLHSHSSVGLSDGSLLTIAGRDPHELSKAIWKLSAETGEWSYVGDLLTPVELTSSIWIGASLYVFSGKTFQEDLPIQRVDFSDNEIRTERIGGMQQLIPRPIMFLATENFCTA
ncbi:Oidioi.mRNA.OKI2018_I69.chr1.g1542.t1.cds [Oikopleura dioica]|uniref:Oidioi.mRNA.OKI2018_I69.chr1.g1542.t1.cds n=1 Tax=Oikopleura dioica TaxID=34765 RepID=A0ABN7SNR3_OIKDI|nr:Oidioi.mRNA.OKI2018_I69.chr1.g1542.t1.cds [Oikopleura dioica]